MRTCDLIAAALALPDASDGLLAMLRGAVPPETSLRNLRDLIAVVAPPRTIGPLFDGTRASFTPAALRILETFAAELARGNGEGSRWSLELLLACAFAGLDDADRRTLTAAGLDVAKAEAGLREAIARLQAPLRPLLDDAGRLLAEEFTGAAFAAIQEAVRQAGQLGADRVLPQHLFLGLLAETEGALEQAIRVQAAPGTGPQQVREILNTAFTMGPARHGVLAADRQGLGIAVVRTIEAAQQAALGGGRQVVDTADLVRALLQLMPASLAGVLSGPCRLDGARLLTQVEQMQRNRPTGSEAAFRLPASVLPSEDLTHAARQGPCEPAIGFDPWFEPIERALHRKRGSHVVIVGERGVGKTTLLRELARRGATGAMPTLARKRLLRVDCTFLDPRDSAGRLQALLAHVDGRTDVVLCVDDIGPLLRTEDGGTNVLLLRAALQQERIRVVATAAPGDYEDLFAPDPDLARLFTRIDLAEPGATVAREIVAAHAHKLAAEFALTIDAAAVDRAVVLPAEYLLNERLPGKSLRILRRVCEDLEFDRQRGGSGPARVGAAQVIAAVAQVSGVPVATLAGVTDAADYEGELRRMVLGQESAVAAMAADLRRIKAGRKKPGTGPASVVLFAGLTGTGKTELAKAVARLYSSSKRLQVYTMANFTEPHSVAGLIGSPVGYHGHEQGGALINALNADPYGVFLLDEAEKAHPNVWKPFLNLFAEGWIVDTRGVRARADRSIFILTSNAGAEELARLVVAGRPPGEVVEAAKQALRSLRHGGEIVFSPEFLARLDRVIIFRSLDRGAMLGVTRLAVQRLADDYRERRGKELHVDDDLLARIAGLAHAANERSGWKEGGRVANRLVREYVDDRIQAAELAAPAAWQTANRMEVGIDPVHPGVDAPEVVVRFAEVPPPSAGERAARAARDLQGWLQAHSASTLAARLAVRLDELRGELAAEPGAALLADARARLQAEAERSMAAVTAATDCVLRELARLGGKP